MIQGNRNYERDRHARDDDIAQIEMHDQSIFALTGCRLSKHPRTRFSYSEDLEGAKVPSEPSDHVDSTNAEYDPIFVDRPNNEHPDMECRLKDQGS